MQAHQLKRCVIYTRKSSEEGLEQNFNSLDAQREACEALHQEPGRRRLAADQTALRRRRALRRDYGAPCPTASVV
jgi:DNA invertase Pin-like site-specific DNA recombinase